MASNPESKRSIHVGVGTRDVRRVDAGVDEPVVPVLEYWDVLFEDIINMI